MAENVGMVSRPLGVILLALFVGYIVWLIISARKSRTEEPDAAASVRRASMSFLEQIRTVADRAEMALEELKEEEGQA